MRPGDLVELKAGLHGLKPPENLGIFLERKKRKKDFFLVVVTVKGVKEVNAQQLGARRFHVAVDPGEDEAALVARLKELIRDAAGGALDLRKEEAAAPEERTLWERVVNDLSDAASPEAIATAFAGTGVAAPRGDVRRVEEILERCRRPGFGFFRAEGRGLWRPIPVEDYKAFRRGLEACHRLRKKLVRVVIVDDGSGTTWERLEGLAPADAGLDESERALLSHVAEGMATGVLHDGWPGTVTPPGSTVHTLEGQSYTRLLETLARDWTGGEGVTRSSTLVQFLVDSGHASVQDAIRLIARRRVLAAPGFAWETPESIERSADRFVEPAEAAATDPSVYAPRTDLRNLETYTIDPADARDFDDAVSLETYADGAATLWVHVADVSHYVAHDSALDRHARERGTSVYLPTGVLPMLPHRLSDDLCSLRAERDRLALTVCIDLDAEGKITASQPMETVIRVAANLSYGEVDAWIVQGKQPFAALQALSQRMRTHRRGLEIETGELRIRFAAEEAARAARREGLAEAPGAPPKDSPADPLDTGLTVAVKHATPATKLVEAFMVAANEAVARYVDAQAVPVPFRCHPLPERGRAERFEAQARALGLDVRIDLPAATGGPSDDEGKGAGPSVLELLAAGKIQLGGFVASDTKPAPAEDAAAPPPPAPQIRGLAQLSPDEREAWLAPFRAALIAVESIENAELRALAYLKVLGTMGRAFYTPRNLGHFGLGSDSYAHFTSPIRRYPDLMLHRQLRWVLRKGAGLPVPDEPPHAAVHLEAFCAQSSERGEGAESLERGVLASCLTFESRKAAWTGALSAMVMGITPGGVFLQLPGGLEARLAVRDLPGGPYETDEHGTMLFRALMPGLRPVPDDEDVVRLGLSWREYEDPDTGELREVRLRLGDRVRVSIRERDFVEGRVNVRLSS